MSIRLEGLVASTRPMAIYGGFRFPENTIRLLESRIRNGEIPLGLHHDPRTRTDATILSTELKSDSDGNLEVWVLIEVDEEEWIGNGWSTATGFSPEMSLPIIGDDTIVPSVTIGADAYWFSDDQIRDACQAMSEKGLTACGQRLYHFSELPRAIVHFAMFQLPNLPPGILSSYIYDCLRHFFRHKPTKELESAQSEFSLDLTDANRGLTTTAYLRTSSDVVLRYAIDNLPQILLRGGDYDYSEENGRWKDRDSR